MNTHATSKTHEHYYQYDGTQVDDERQLMPVQHWYKCAVCGNMVGRRPRPKPSLPISLTYFL